jgi:hypothetical protein
MPELQDGAATSNEDNGDLLCKICLNLSERLRNVHFASLKQSAEDGCPCCSTLICIFEQFEHGNHRLVDAAADCYLDTQIYSKNDQSYAFDLEIPSLNALIGLSVAPGNSLLNCYAVS